MSQSDRLADIHYRLDVILEELSELTNEERDHRRASSLSRIQDGVSQSIDRIHEFQEVEPE